MALTLRLRSGGIEPDPELQLDAPRLVIGRAAGCDLQLPDPSVSSRHASLRQRGSDYVIVDEGSENGTYSGPERLVRHAPHTLRDGELLRFGRVWVQVELGPSRGAAESGASRELARRLVEHALAEDEAPHGMRVACEGMPDKESLHLQEPRRGYVIGRQKSADYRLDDSGLPARAIELRRQGDQLWVTLQSDAVEAQLGERELALGERTAWPRGTVLKLGTEQLTFSDPTAQILERLERGPTEILAKDATLEPPRGAEALEDVWDETAESDPDSSALGPLSSHALGIASAPAHRERTRSNAGRWTSADAIIFLVALGMLGLSLWAIRWLAHLGPA